MPSSEDARRFPSATPSEASPNDTPTRVRQPTYRASNEPTRPDNADEREHESGLPLGKELGNPARYFLRYRRWVALGILALTATNGLAYAVPRVIKLTIDRVELAKGQPNALTGVGWLALLIGLMAFAQGLIRVLSRIFIFNAGRDAEFDLRRGLFSKLCLLDQAFYRRYRVGDLMSRLTNDLAAVRALFGVGVLHSVNTIFAYAIALPLMITIDPWLTLWALLPYPILLVGAKYFARGIYTRSHGQQEALASMTASVQEDLAGIRELKSYTLERQRSAHFGERSRHYLHEALRLTAWRTGMMPFIGAGVGASLVIILWVGGRRVIAGQLSLGDLVAFNIYVGLLAWPTLAIGWMLSLWQRGIAAWQRLGAIYQARSGIVDVVASDIRPADATLRIDRLNITIDQKVLLHDIGLDVPAGSICAIVGPTGSGKSTLLEVIGRLIDVEPNSFYFGKRDVTTMSLAAVRSQVAYAPQEAFLFSTTIAKNVEFGLDDDELEAAARETRVRQAVSAAGLDPDLEALPNGIDTEVGERGVTLSGGQRQRVALARALVSRRPLILLDDSLSAVDAETERRILSGLKAMLAGRSALIVSHRLSALVHADQIVVLDEGRVVEQGEHRELIQRDGLYARLYQRQMIESTDGRAEADQDDEAPHD